MTCTRQPHSRHSMATVMRAAAPADARGAPGSRDVHAPQLVRGEHGARLGAHHAPAVLRADQVHRPLAVHVPVGQRHRGVGVRHEGACHRAQQLGVHVLGPGQALGQLAEGGQRERVVAGAAGRVRRGRLERGQARLQVHHQLRLGRQRVQAVQVLQEQSDQPLPLGRVKQRRVARAACVRAKRQRGHRALQLAHVLPCPGREVCARVRDGVHAPLRAHQLQEFLHAQLELQPALDLPQLGAVVGAPRQRARAVVAAQRLHHLLRLLEDVGVHQCAQPRLLRGQQ
mmetsp:Transcript_25750/g.65484  ORF Transcript_25750/g.65484 Transcript_25750/m.65484 type:complete len:285 (-) Transcript_25750:478-1332(-)